MDRKYIHWIVGKPYSVPTRPFGLIQNFVWNRVYLQKQTYIPVYIIRNIYMYMCVREYVYVHAWKSLTNLNLSANFLETSSKKGPQRTKGNVE